MSSLQLVLGNKNYSSWSLRPWLALKVKDIPFEEIQLRLDFEHGNQHLLDYSPTKKVPALIHGELTVWESLAILEYVAELYPDKCLWPDDRAQRAHARAISSEMHAGFFDLRGECPMNIRRTPRAIAVSDGAKQDVARVEAIWRTALDSSGGPFLFKDFTIADAMFAPVVNRLTTYELCSDKAALAYCDSMMALAAWKDWEAASKAEPWVIEPSEL